MKATLIPRRYTCGLKTLRFFLVFIKQNDIWRELEFLGKVSCCVCLSGTPSVVLDDFQGGLFWSVPPLWADRQKIFTTGLHWHTHSMIPPSFLTDKCTDSARQLAGGELSLKATSLIFPLLPFLPLLISSLFLRPSPPISPHCADTHLLALGFSLILPSSNRF